MKQVLLIRPHYGLSQAARDRPLPYLGHLAVGASLLRAGYRVTLVDEPAGEEPWPRIEAALPDCLYVGISAMTVQVPAALRLVRLIRAARPELPIVWGGIHPTLFPEETCDGRHCDVAVVGEGDQAAVLLAWALEKGLDLGTIPGIAYRVGNRVVRTEPGEPLDLNRLPRPAYELLSRTETERLGISTELATGLSTFVAAGRGCPYRCSFCVNTVLPRTSRRHRVRDPALVLEDVRWLQQTYGIETFLLQDEDFFTRRDRVERFLEGIQEQGLRFTWQAAARANYFRAGYLDEDLLRRLEAAGCLVLGIGAESGSGSVLEILLKDIRPEQVQGAVKSLAATPGITGVLSYMVGIPGETRRDILLTLREIGRLSRLGASLYVGGPYVFRAYPGSRLYQEAVAAGLRVPDSLEGWESTLSSEEGFLTAEQTPWMSERRLIAYGSTMVPFLFTGRRGQSGGLRSRAGRGLQLLLERLYRARAETGYYGLLWEDRLLRLALSLG